MGARQEGTGIPGGENVCRAVKPVLAAAMTRAGQDRSSSEAGDAGEETAQTQEP